VGNLGLDDDDDEQRGSDRTGRRSLNNTGRIKQSSPEGKEHYR